MDFSQLKANRKSQFGALADKANIASGNGRPAKKEYEPDPRYWKLKRDESDNGSAIIRFLPAPENEDIPFTKYWTHSFNNNVGGQKRWYIERSRATINQPDPVSEMNKALWDSSDDNEGPARNQARRQKRSNKYVSNILVIKDPANKENEGRVFLFEYGPSIFSMINDKMHPEFEEDEAINPFDFWEGANFRLRIYKGSNNFMTYDKSYFDSPSALHNDDQVLENIWKKQYSLEEINAESNFKSYDDLKDKLDWVLDLKSPTPANQDSDSDWEAPVAAPTPEPATEAAWTPPTEDFKRHPPEAAPVADDDDLDFFKNWEDKTSEGDNIPF